MPCPYGHCFIYNLSMHGGGGGEERGGGRWSIDHLVILQIESDLDPLFDCTQQEGKYYSSPCSRKENTQNDRSNIKDPIIINYPHKNFWQYPLGGRLAMYFTRKWLAGPREEVLILKLQLNFIGILFWFRYFFLLNIQWDHKPMHDSLDPSNFFDYDSGIFSCHSSLLLLFFFFFVPLFKLFTYFRHFTRN